MIIIIVLYYYYWKKCEDTDTTVLVALRWSCQILLSRIGIRTLNDYHYCCYYYDDYYYWKKMKTQIPLPWPHCGAIVKSYPARVC